ncbi:MAG: glycosyltransferase [Fimbriimonadales bacterium]|nr:glycosyltransferase [Fimbriimonadales bacterium]
MELSILIPARNERENLPRLLASLASQLGAGVECWVCDDGSDDGTTEWLMQHADALGVRWFRSAPRPDGWVGKNWACYQLAARAQGAWLLFLDADLRCEAGFVDALRGYLAHTDAQLVSAIPTFTPSSLPVALLKIMVPFSVFTLLPLALAERHPNSAFAFANGQVIAMRKADYARWLPHFFVRGAVLEDVALAALVKRHRGVVHLLDARAWLRVSMYPTLREAMNGFAKNAVAICRTVPLAVFVGLMLALVYLYPLGALWASAQRGWATAAVLAAVAIFGLSARVVGLPFRLGWLYAGSVALGLLTLWRSIRWYRRGAIVWKGRVYRA